MRSQDSLDLLFPNKLTRDVARYFLKELVKSEGQINKTALSLLADSLNDGIYGGDNPLKYSRRNFYMTILNRLVSLGFIRKNVPIWDSTQKRTLYVYQVSIFDIPKTPPSIGFWRLAWYVCKKWNRMFESETKS